MFSGGGRFLTRRASARMGRVETRPTRNTLPSPRLSDAKDWYDRKEWRRNPQFSALAKLHISGTMQAKSSRIPMHEIETQPKKVFAVHRIIGRYEIEGTVTCIPAPPPST